MLNFDHSFSKAQIDKAKKLGKRIGYIVLAVVLLVLLLVLTFKFLTEYIWMDSVGFSSVFTTVLWNKVLLGVVGFILFAVSGFFTLFWTRKSYIKHFHVGQLPTIVLNKIKMYAIFIGMAILFGLIGSGMTQSLGWERLLKALNYESFGQTDPYFNLDISFYIFVLPFLKFLIYLLLGLSVFYFLTQLAAYSVFHMYRMSRSAQIHMGVTLAVMGVLLACIHVLAPFDTLFTNSVNIFQNSVVHGLSYTDDVINIPKAYVLAGVAILGAIWMIISIVRGKIQHMLIAPIVYVGLVIIGQFASFAVQNFIVSPNEFSKESPYLEHNLAYTKDAYQLSEIEEKEHPGNDSLDEDMVERNKQTIDNIRINDVLPLLEVYNSRDTIRSYYNFHDVDVDRYEIDGDYEQVFIGTRELDTDNLPEQAQTWVNRYLRYTHGYGVVMSHVNDVTSQGQPEYMIKDIPPTGTIDIERPQIYFGEADFPNVIANSKVDEFDYPAGQENMSTRFDADAGIPMTRFNRLLFAISEGSFRMFVSDQITEDSRLLKTRNIMDRVNRIAPFFKYDDDPYVFIREDGSLGWIIDAYVSAERYPYSESYANPTNYIRNSVKVVVDAYTGDVDFYVVDDEDPVLQTYMNMFPELFTEEIPEDVQAHFRYPEVLFNIQARMYGTYHMSNLEVFYNREDFWEFPTEKYYDSDVVMDPYYITMKLPEEDEEEFILMVPYTPKNRQNMIAWIGVRNDGDRYGEMFVHRFPKQKNIYGPQQIENRINQDSYISQQLNLWSQGGSEVIRGNLLAIPLEDTVFYVEPIYIQSSNETSLPEVKQIVIAYEDFIVMEPTFEEALDELLELIASGATGNIDEIPEDGDGDLEGEPDKDQNETPDVDPDIEIPGDVIEDAEKQLREIAKLFDDYQDAMSERKWEEAANVMVEIEEKLDAIQE